MGLRVREKGVELASREYVTFVDEDDTIEKDFLKILVDPKIRKQSQWQSQLQ